MSLHYGNRKFWLISALALLLLLLLWTWFQRNFERRSIQVETGWSAAARRNPYLAAERFLQGAGIPADSAPSHGWLQDLPPTSDLLVIDRLESLNPQRQQRLRAWLEEGGQLLVEAVRLLEPDEEPPDDDFLASFGALLRVDAGKQCKPEEVIAKVAFDSHPELVEVGFDSRYYLQDTSNRASILATAGSQPRLLQYPVGDGLLMVASDLIFLTNRDIGNHDHAFALALMSKQVDKVWLFYSYASSASQSLARILWHSAPHALIALALLLAALLWHFGRPIGPLLPAPSRARRNLADHLEASAMLLWRYGRGGLQLETTRRRVEQAWLRRHPLLRDLDNADRAEWISKQVGIGSQQVYDALYRQHQSARDFTAQSRVLQRLWSGL